MIAHSVPVTSVRLILARIPTSVPVTNASAYEETCASVPAVLDFWN